MAKVKHSFYGDVYDGHDGELGKQIEDWTAEKLATFQEQDHVSSMATLERAHIASRGLPADHQFGPCKRCGKTRHTVEVDF